MYFHHWCWYHTNTIIIIIIIISTTQPNDISNDELTTIKYQLGV